MAEEIEQLQTEAETLLRENSEDTEQLQTVADLIKEDTEWTKKHLAQMTVDLATRSDVSELKTQLSNLEKLLDSLSSRLETLKQSQSTQEATPEPTPIPVVNPTSQDGADENPEVSTDRVKRKRRRI